MKMRSRVIGVGVFILFLLGCQTAHKPRDYPFQPVPFTAVKIVDDFWAPRIETNRTVTIPHAFQKCEETGRVDNFAIAGGQKQGEQKGIYPFDDTDIYKTLEGASYALMVEPDPEMDKYLDDLIALIAAAQEEDGYVYTARTNKSDRLKNWMGDERWTNLSRSHELYNAGHLYEAATAHYLATGKRNLLDIALKNADLVDNEFGPGKRQEPPGHQVIEMGLVKLYRVTGEKKYLDLAKFLLDVRGKPLDGRDLGGEYNQDHAPVTEQAEAVGHAVRASYMYSGMADIAALTGDKEYLEAIDRIWENVAGKKLYLTGGIGANPSGEAFENNYELPNMSAYNETCAAIGNVYWNHRLFLLHGESKYIDVLERTLYNGLLSGISLDGTRFFYPNALESVGQHERSLWFGCACCPGNVTRFIASVPGYIYAHRDENLYVNLYVTNEATVDMRKGPVHITQETRYPWDGTVRIGLTPSKHNNNFALCLRIPGWAQNEPVPSDLYRYLSIEKQDITVNVNGESVPLDMENGYVSIERAWEPGDVIELTLPMSIRRVEAHDNVDADRGKVALERGPLVFCAEWPDNPDGHVRNFLLDDNTPLKTEFLPDLLRGVQVIRGTVDSYRVIDDEGNVKKSEKDFMAIPYYAWAHRGKGEMAVWLAREETSVNPLGRPTLASTSKVSASFGRNPGAVHDQLEPKSSSDHEVPFFHWWPHKGTTEWIQYDFPELSEVSMTEVYWFDDTGKGECRPPKSWRILYWDGKNWRPVYTVEKYGVEKDIYNTIVFETVRTKSLRLEIDSQPGYAGGIHEWHVK
jgi:DUF1680 family protein